jgi:hypothetical protein
MNSHSFTGIAVKRDMLLSDLRSIVQGSAAETFAIDFKQAAPDNLKALLSAMANDLNGKPVAYTTLRWEDKQEIKMWSGGRENTVQTIADILNRLEDECRKRDIKLRFSSGSMRRL